MKKFTVKGLFQSRYGIKLENTAGALRGQSPRRGGSGGRKTGARGSATKLPRLPPLLNLALAVGVFCLCLGCSRSAPRIPYGVIQLAYYQGQGAPEERFSFFVLAEDDDGIENLEELYLYHDHEGLRWRLSFEDWISFDDNGKTWIGSRAIAMPDNESLPRGQYRVVLINKGGERTERLLAFDAPLEPRHSFPVFDVSEGNYTISSSYPRHSFICYDGEGNVTRTAPVENLSGAIESLGLSSNVRALALWAEDAEYQTSALTDLVVIR